MDKKTTILQATCIKLSVILTLLFGWSSHIEAQCDFSCSDHVYLALDERCEHHVTIDEVMTDVTGCDNAVVMIFDDYGNNLGSHLRREHRGKKLTYKVIDNETQNSCWGYLTVEDKMAPLIECADDTVNCWEAAELLDPDLEDNCWDVAYFEQSKLVWVDYECENDTFVGYYERDVITQDLWGNTSRCYGQRLYILREQLDSLVCPEEEVEIECCTQRTISGQTVDVLWDTRFAYEDEDGYAHPIPGEGLLVEPPYLNDRGQRHYLTPEGNTKGKCNIITEYKDHIIPTCATTYKIRREWKLFDWCTGEDTICVQWIKITDTTAPKVKHNGIKEICLNDPSHLWLNTDASFDCESVQAYDITPSEGACTAPRTYYVSPHDCKAHVTLSRPEIIEECAFKFAKGDADKEAEELAKIKVTYQLQYFDHVILVRL